ncbi:hypothetical protein GGI04_001203 [Coemansia thaxteri]|uniref:Uncharacterized protein n=1 Tax=Coemansia thaxteri TaxID=2663907 RepID=A0A9W8EG10_9FUNG|nr:hypothetical protein H4R26_002032 [Coemansia thaxteri]KAJ2008280.1 hypothetical protein GGI04_001203 [Coemansia thaxteri]KAJ2473114.1 hypothetical protein GGI02_001095 [Coemansia sp. RSA 2322]KAJ2485217.1 hypothetical protein EV174_001881 [Coemansia sp. RSA 2320]
MIHRCKLAVRSAAPPSIRSISSTSYGGSSNFVAGKQGYAPGFPPPRHCRDAPQPRAEPPKASDLPAPQKKSKRGGDNYREKLRALRFAYMHEHLEAQETRREQRAASLAAARERHRDLREKVRRERTEYETQVRDDPLSAANVLNGEGQTVVRNLIANNGLSGEKEIGFRGLAPPRVSISMPVEGNAARADERARNRRVAGSRRHEDNVQALMALFHSAESFVHYGNLASKINEVLAALTVSHRSLGEMVESLNKNGGVTTPAETARRTRELENTLQGTAGPKGGLGHAGLVQWLDEHPADAAGIRHVEEDEKD